ncbi:hypothetical protein SUDANB121_05891 (plasmid) [Nocardiopsis dassonvillei]|uniref:hypothetical protein n=1 Tax=Nocardiopsis dassonvillei TaxID=2014 RepID=UPI003F5431D1
MAAPTAEPVLSPLVEALAAVDLADAARPGGIRAGVEQAAGLIRTHVAAWSTGPDADIVPLPSNTTTEGAAA